MKKQKMCSGSLNLNIFPIVRSINKAMQLVDKEIRASGEDFILHFKELYEDHTLHHK